MAHFSSSISPARYDCFVVGVCLFLKFSISLIKYRIINFWVTPMPPFLCLRIKSNAPRFTPLVNLMPGIAGNYMNNAKTMPSYY